MARIGQRALQGAIAGFIGTLLMSVVMTVGRSVGRPWALHLQVVTRRAEHDVGIRRDLTRSEFSINWALAHTAYGVLAGTVYAVLRPFLPRSTGLAGLAYGAAIWGISFPGTCHKFEDLPILGDRS